MKLEQADVLERAAPASGGVMIANPPYGERMGSLDELALFYPKLGDALKQRFAGWRCYLFTADLRLPKLIRLSPSRAYAAVERRDRVPALRVPDGRRSSHAGFPPVTRGP